MNATAGFETVHKDDTGGIPIVGGKDHTAAFHAAQLGGFQVGNHDHLAAFEVFGLIPQSNARSDGARLAAAVIQRQFQQFLGFFHGFAINHARNTQINLRELVNADLRQERNIRRLSFLFGGRGSVFCPACQK